MCYFKNMKKSAFGEARNFPAEENLKRLSSGSVLLARDALQDPNFDATVVLICIHSPEGAYGLVLNRPSHMPLSEIFDGFIGLPMKREFYIGGPVQQEELQVLQITETPVDEAFQVAPKVYLSGKWGIAQIVETDPATTHLFLGYSGWAPGQIENEILAGAWDVYKPDIVKLFATPEKIVDSDAGNIAQFIESLQ